MPLLVFTARAKKTSAILWISEITKQTFNPSHLSREMYKFWYFLFLQVKKKWGGLGRGKMLSVMFFLLLNSSSASKLQQISKAREAEGQTELQRWDINYFHKTVFLRVTLQWQKKWHNGTEDFKTQTSQGQVFGPKASLPFLDRCGASYWSDCTPRAQRTVLYLKTCMLKWLYPINSYLSCFADELNDHMQVLYLYRFYSRLRTVMKRPWITQHCLNLISLKAFQAVILIDL